MATIRKLRNKWQAQVRLKGAKPQAKSFSLKSDAVAWARMIEAEIQKGVFVDTSVAERMTVREAIEKYLSSIGDEKKQRIERSTPHFSRTFRETDFLDCGPQGELNHSVLEPYDVIFHT